MPMTARHEFIVIDISPIFAVLGAPRKKTLSPKFKRYNTAKEPRESHLRTNPCRQWMFCH